MDHATVSVAHRMLNKLGNVVEAKRAAEERLRASALDYVILRPGVFVDNAQGGLVFAGEDRFLGEADDARGLDRVSCKSPFFASSGAACGVDPDLKRSMARMPLPAFFQLAFARALDSTHREPPSVRRFRKTRESVFESSRGSASRTRLRPFVDTRVATSERTRKTNFR